MKFENVVPEKKKLYNSLITHPLQSYEWGQFRQSGGVTIVRQVASDGKEAFTMTIHKIPKTPFAVGYLPKGTKPSQELLAHLRYIGKKYKCIFIQMEPDVLVSEGEETVTLFKRNNIRKSARPLFTKYTFLLNLSQPEKKLLDNMHPKTRYNIKVAQKNGVTIVEDSSDAAFKEYLRLTSITTKRQKFFAHSQQYHKLMWETLKSEGIEKNKLSAHLFLAKFRPGKNEQEKVLTSWIIFTLHDKIYYPYGASSNEYRNVMASNLLMWEVIRFGKKNGFDVFDMWGALGSTPDTSDPWYGFHRFKKGYGATHTEYIGSYDLVINKSLYPLYSLANNLRWKLLKIFKI